MGTAISDIVYSEDIDVDSLRKKILVVDSYNILYQFLSSIRQRNGQLLRDSKGRVTSHLVGLLSRTTKWMSKGLKLVFVFDGVSPDLKSQEISRRKELKQEAKEKFEEAKKEKDIEEMRKYASRTSRLTPEMVEEAKKLVQYLGCPVIQAPSEGEAQAACMVKQGDCYAVVSQDYDTLVYGAERLIQNLNVSQKRRQKNKATYRKVSSRVVLLSETLNNLGIDREQLIVISMLVGTDFNPGGVKGVGPKTALKLVKKHGKDFEALFKEAEWDKNLDISWKRIYTLIKNMQVETNYTIEWNKYQEETLTQFLKEYDFSDSKIERAIKRLKKSEQKKQQTALGDFV